MRYSLLPMHDLDYFRQHLDLFEQMARNRNASIDFDAFAEVAPARLVPRIAD